MAISEFFSITQILGAAVIRSKIEISNFSKLLERLR